MTMLQTPEDGLNMSPFQAEKGNTLQKRVLGMEWKRR